MAKKLLEIGPLEMEVLGALQKSGEAPVSDVQSALKVSGHDLAYTTVMTVLTRLYGKGHLQRRKEGRGYVYAPAKKREASAFGIFDRVKSSLFGSERLKPILSLLDAEEELSRDELEQLKKAVEERIEARLKTQRKGKA